MGTLTHERVGTGGLAIGLRAELDQMIASAREHNPDALDDPGIRDRIARMYTQVELTRLLNARALSKVLKGERTWPEVQIAKLQWSHLSQALAELNVDLLGPLGVLAKGGPDAIAGGHAAHNYPWQRFTSIGAGATEVQKNIIADRAIQLPAPLGLEAVAEAVPAVAVQAASRSRSSPRAAPPPRPGARARRPPRERDGGQEHHGDARRCRFSVRALRSRSATWPRR